MDQLEKILTTKPNGMILISRGYTVEGENHLSQVVLSLPHLCHDLSVCACAHRQTDRHTHNKCDKNFLINIFNYFLLILL